MFYLYGKHVCNCKWMPVGEFSTMEQMEEFMDYNEYTDDNPNGIYLSFYIIVKFLNI